MIILGEASRLLVVSTNQTVLAAAARPRILAAAGMCFAARMWGVDGLEFVTRNIEVGCIQIWRVRYKQI